MLPLVSVVMTAFDCERFIGEALESALGQDYPADRLEIVVVDDGSSDATAAVARRYVAGGRARLRRGEASDAEIAAAWSAFEHNAAEAIRLARSPFEVTVAVTKADRAEAIRLAASATDRAAFVRAAAADPWYEPARAGVRDAERRLGALVLR